MKAILNKPLASFLSLALLLPGPALAADVARALPTTPKLTAAAPLPQLKPLTALLPQTPVAVTLPPVDVPGALLPVLSHERPVEAVIPRVFEPSTLDAAPDALTASPVFGGALAISGAENLHRSTLLAHGHEGHGHGATPPGGGGDGEISSLKKALLVSGALVAVELAGGLMLDSLALRADALHLTADWALNALALGAMLLSRRPGAGERWKKAEPFVGLFSSAVIGFTAFEIGKEALERLAAPMEFSAPAVIALALCGLAANGLASAILYKHRDGGLGARSVFLHALTDAAGSLSVAVSSALLWAFNWGWVDPLASALIVLLISKTAFTLGRQSWKALRTPANPKA